MDNVTTNERRIVHIMQLLGDENRFKIFKLLGAKDELCVSEIADKLHITASAVSQHFRQFELLNLVEKARNGQKICYALRMDDPFIRTLTSLTANQSQEK